MLNNRTNIFRTKLFIPLLFFFLAGSLFLNIGKVPLNFEEPRRALVAIEMILSDNYFVPTINGLFYYNKPPLFNWMLVVVYQLSGVYEEWAGRVITNLSLLLVAVLLFFLVKKYINRRTALFAGFFWATSAHIYFFYSQLGEIDLFYTLLVFIQMVSIFHFYERKNYLALFVLSYVFMALGVLTKGLPSVAFQGLTLLGVFIINRDFKKLLSWPHFLGLAVGMLIIFLYFYIYSFYNSPVVFLLNLISESSDRVVAKGNLWDAVKHIVYFPFKHLHIFLPWAVFGFVFFDKNVRRLFFNNRLLQFSLVFIAANIIPYWLSPGTKDRYLYAFVPFGMIIFASIAERHFCESKFRKYIEHFFLLFIISLIPAAMYFPFFKPFEAIGNIWVISLVFCATFGALAWIYVRQVPHRVWVMILALVAARFAYDLTVLPSRERSAAVRRPYQEMTSDINTVARGQKVYAYGPVKREKINVPLSTDIEVDSAACPYYTVSFYYSVVSGEVMTFTGQKQPEVFYLSEPKYLSTESVDILKEYYVKETDRHYVLFKFLD